MKDKVFKAVHARTGEEREIEGNDFTDALERAELTSIHWQDKTEPNKDPEE